MGSFPGHALPGTFFILFGLWYIIQSFRRYFKCRESGAKFKSTMTFPCSCCCGRLKHWPVEPMVKIFFVAFGFAVEIIAGFSDGKFTAIGNGQHATMFFFFGLSGLVDVLTHFKVPIPTNTDYMSFAMALGVEGLLFHFHLYGRTPLDVLVHTLLIYAVLVSIVCVFVEMRYPHSLLSPLSRGYMLLLQGTWFWQVGNILYPPLGPTWDEHEHEQLMIATLYFVWHGGVNFLVTLLIGAVIACRYRHRSSYYSNEINIQKLGQQSTKPRRLNNDSFDDSDSDLEKQETKH